MQPPGLPSPNQSIAAREAPIPERDSPIKFSSNSGTNVTFVATLTRLKGGKVTGGRKTRKLKDK